MATKLVNKGNSVYEVSTSVSGQAWKDAQDKALKRLASKVEVKGFRKGNAPIELAKQRINPADLINEAINLCLPAAYNDALKEHKLRPFGNPDVKVTAVKEDGFDVTFTVTTYPEVKLGQYKGIKVPLEVGEVTEKEVNEAIDHLLADNSELVLKDGPAAKGDTVVFDFKGYIDGKEFEGGSADNYSLVLGSNQFIPGFEDQLVGVTSETKKDVLVKFPEQYVKDLAGKDAKFVCMIHEIKEKKVPELNEEFVASLNIADVKTVEDLKKHEEKVLFEQHKHQAQNNQFTKILKTICDNAEVTIADKVLEDEANRMKEDLIRQIEQNGLTFEQYKEITGMDDEKINAQFKSDAKNRLTEYVVLGEIGNAEHLTISKGEVDAYYESVAKQYNMKVEDVKKTFASSENRIVENLYQNKIERFIIANNGDVKEEASETKAEVKEETANEKKSAAKKTTKKTTAKAKEGTTTKKTTTRKTTKKTTETVKEETK